MPLVINTNVASINAQRNLGTNTNMLSKSIERLSSGFRINKAGDDAAGLQISENLRAQIRGSKKALDNVQDGTNVLNIADGALATITENLQRMRELAVQAANDTYDSASRTAIETELDQLATEITRISDATQFNGVKLLDGSINGTNNMVLQVGYSNNATQNTIDVGSTGAFADTDATALGVNDASIDVTNNTNARTALNLIDTALTRVNTQRANIGATINRLERAATNLSTQIENVSAAESRIRNVDVAAESAELVRNQILQQSSAAMLSQANQFPSIALQLLQG
jgi:flagellin